MKDIEQFIFERLKRNVDFKWLQFTCKEDFYIAENSLNNSTPNDIDIFPSSILPNLASIPKIFAALRVMLCKACSFVNP